MNAEEETPERAPGTTTIAPEVLVTIVRLTALRVPGVVRLANLPGGVNRLFRRGAGEGVRIEVENTTVSVDLYVELEPEVNVREICAKIQSEIARAIQDMVSMHIERIDVHVMDISYDDPVG
jgi:uncharacterized alkaline shock family protein YloU